MSARAETPVELRVYLPIPNLAAQFAAYLGTPTRARGYPPIAGDNAQSKAAVSNFLDSIGYGAVDYGPLAESWRQQPGEPVYGTPYGPMDDEGGCTATEEMIRTALAAAIR